MDAQKEIDLAALPAWYGMARQDRPGQTMAVASALEAGASVVKRAKPTECGRYFGRG